MLSDRYFLVDAEKAIRLHSQHSKSPAYYFTFSYVLEQESLFGKHLPAKGVLHSDDGKILFRIFGTPEELPGNDERAKDLLTEFIYNYASRG